MSTKSTTAQPKLPSSIGFATAGAFDVFLEHHLLHVDIVFPQVLVA
jgi:hypothetical protein